MALDPKSDITALLRKTWFISRKLKVEALGAWADRELNGYKDTDIVPAYRIIRGELVVWNPAQGWIPVYFRDNAAGAEAICNQNFRIPIAEIQALLRAAYSGSVWASFNTELEHHIRKVLISDIGRPNFQPKLQIPTATLHATLDAVRQQVLDWAMKLEEDGILGDDVTFNEKEMLTAANHTYTTNLHFHGAVSGTQIQGTAISSSQTMTNGSPDLEKVLLQIVENIQKANGASADQIELAEAHAATLRSQGQLSADKRSGSIIDKAIKGLSAISSALSVSKQAVELLPELIKLVS